MKFRQTFMVLTLGCGTLLGCDDQPAPVAVKDHAATSARETETGPPTTRPAVVMLVDGVQREFPAPRLVVEDRNSRTVALLMSDDPPQAINDDYTGNSYYLELEFDDVLPTVRGQVWTYEAPDSERQDTPNGIFLRGNRVQLQPFQLKVQFQQIEGADVAWISGTFRAYAAEGQPGLAPVVSVTGRLPVTLP